MKSIYLIVVLVILFIAGGFIFIKGNIAGDSIDSVNSIHKGVSVTLFYESTCGCCKNYVKYLENNGFNVKTVPTSNGDNIKDNFGIPSDKRSCHIMKIGDYFVEGHVPIKAIDKLLKEKPDINGIALPGMPSGSPGMSGTKFNEFTIYSIKNGETDEFIKI